MIWRALSPLPARLAGIPLCPPRPAPAAGYSPNSRARPSQPQARSRLPRTGFWGFPPSLSRRSGAPSCRGLATRAGSGSQGGAATWRPSPPRGPRRRWRSGGRRRRRLTSAAGGGRGRRWRGGRGELETGTWGGVEQKVRWANRQRFANAGEEKEACPDRLDVSHQESKSLQKACPEPVDQTLPSLQHSQSNDKVASLSSNFAKQRQSSKANIPCLQSAVL